MSAMFLSLLHELYQKRLCYLLKRSSLSDGVCLVHWVCCTGQCASVHRASTTEVLSARAANSFKGFKHKTKCQYSHQPLSWTGFSREHFLFKPISCLLWSSLEMEIKGEQNFFPLCSQNVKAQKFPMRIGRLGKIIFGVMNVSSRTVSRPVNGHL